MTRKTQRIGPLDGESLLIRFAILVLAVVAAAVAATAIGKTWAFAAALAVLVGLLVEVVVVIARYLRVTDEDPAAEPEDTATSSAPLPGSAAARRRPSASQRRSFADVNVEREAHPWRSRVRERRPSSPIPDRTATITGENLP